MNKISIYFLILMFTCFAGAESPAELVIGFTPSGDRTQTKRAALELASELQNELKIPVAVYLSKNYAGLSEALLKKKIDFAFITSLAYVNIEKKIELKVLLKKVWTEPFYYSVLLSRKSSGIKKIQAIKGKRLTFVDQKSTSGYLYPMVELNKRNLKLKDFKSVSYSGNHAQSVEALLKKETDVIAVFADDTAGELSAWKKYVKTDPEKNDIQILWVSEPIPNDPFVVRQEFYDKYPKTAHNVMFSLIEIAEKFRAKENFKEIISEKGFMPATSRQYEAVREMVKQFDLKVE